MRSLWMIFLLITLSFAAPLDNPVVHTHSKRYAMVITYAARQLAVEAQSIFLNGVEAGLLGSDPFHALGTPIWELTGEVRFHDVNFFITLMGRRYKKLGPSAFGNLLRPVIAAAQIAQRARIESKASNICASIGEDEMIRLLREQETTLDQQSKTAITKQLEQMAYLKHAKAAIRYVDLTKWGALVKLRKIRHLTILQHRAYRQFLKQDAARWEVTSVKVSPSILMMRQYADLWRDQLGQMDVIPLNMIRDPPDYERRRKFESAKTLKDSLNKEREKQDAAEEVVICSRLTAAEQKWQKLVIGKKIVMD